MYYSVYIYPNMGKDAEGSPREIGSPKQIWHVSPYQVRIHRSAASNRERLYTHAPHGEKPLHSIYDRVQCSAGPHRCDTLIFVREIVSPDVHRFALRRQQLLRDLALGRRQRGGYRSEALL